MLNLHFGTLVVCCTNGLLLEIDSGLPVHSAGKGLSTLSPVMRSQGHGHYGPGPVPVAGYPLELSGQQLCCTGKMAGWKMLCGLSVGLQGSAEVGDLFL